MAVYKVPQDVEAEDKIVGPFSLKQFIFILLFFTAGWIAFILSRILLPLGIVMLPFMLVFGVLGFVHRKDQPVEVYLNALVRFYLKPHVKKWDQDGYDQRVIITAPKVIEIHRTKDFSQDEVDSRLSRLANIVDSRGWAAKGLTTRPTDRLVAAQTIVNQDANAPDMMDEGTVTAKNFDTLIQQKSQVSRQAVITRMQQTIPTNSSPPPPPLPRSAPTSSSPSQDSSNIPSHVTDLLNSMTAHYDPYPTDMHQSMVDPSGKSTSIAPGPVVAQPVTPPVSPAIMQLANNNDLTVSAIARHARSLPEEEVVITLR